MQDEQDITLDTEEGIDDSVLADEARGDTIKKLKEKLKAAEAKAKENLDNWQRAQAEFMNLRKRDEEAKSEFVKFAKTDTLAELIPVLDSMNAAISHGQKDIEPIYSQFMQIMKSHGLEEIDPQEEMFDPSKHEAIGMVPTDQKENDHKIMNVFQKGYALNGKVIRPAKVQVGEFAEA
ncbi:MAG: GrpE protein molecular chaperone GrpE [Parcubacteria group bacterium]|nr:GrpE protein molecular chaperone GrpE [Parcubacteria group bacterium]